MGSTTTMAELQQIIKDLALGQKALQKAQQKTELAQQKTELAQQKTELVQQRTEKTLRKAIGDYGNSWGEFLENLVEADLVSLLNDRGVKVNQANRMKFYHRDSNGNVTKDIEAEYDLVAANGKEIVVFEVKKNLDTDKLSRFLGKLKKFRGYSDNYANKKIYGGVAYMKIERGLSLEAAEDAGLF